MVLEADPNNVSILMDIHHNPSYYVGFYLKGIEGNMDVLGSVTADQNYSINVAIIGQGSSMSIVEQISVLFIKNQYVARNHRKMRDAQYISTVTYTSDHGGEEGKDDVHTNISLTVYFYQKLFVKAAKKIIYSIDMNRMVIL